ncbi:MAG: hypothetical protein ABSH49_28780 [Bryobacteraceae bacterium]|jgi:hypothetical protein
MFANFRREIPAPSFSLFLSLQVLDVVTTLIGLRFGASEASMFISRLMRLGVVEALLISKLFALILASAAIGYKRGRVVVFLNYWFAAVVGWNLCAILYTGVSTGFRP